MRLGGSLALHTSNHDKYLQHGLFLQVRVHVHRGHVPRVGEAPVFDAGEDGLHRLDGPLDATALPAERMMLEVAVSQSLVQ